jgi:hypothetical protein
VVAPAGTIFVADGHGGDSNARVVKFSADGKFITAWGKKGSAPGEFNEPHGIALDSSGPYSSPIGPTAGSRSSTRTASFSPNKSSSAGRTRSISTRTM